MSNRLRKHAKRHESGGLDELDLASLAGTLGDAQATQFLLLDGTRAMTGNLDMQANQVQFDIGGKIIFKKGETGEFALEGYGTASQKRLRLYGTGASPDTVRIHVYSMESKFRSGYGTDTYFRPNISTTAYVLYQSYDGAWKTGMKLINNKVLMPNLPTSDPSTEGELWDDSGVVTVSHP